MRKVTVRIEDGKKSAEYTIDEISELESTAIIAGLFGLFGITGELRDIVDAYDRIGAAFAAFAGQIRPRDPWDSTPAKAYADTEEVAAAVNLREPTGCQCAIPKLANAPLAPSGYGCDKCGLIVTPATLWRIGVFPAKTVKAAVDDAHKQMSEPSVEEAGSADPPKMKIENMQVTDDQLQKLKDRLEGRTDGSSEQPKETLVTEMNKSQGGNLRAQAREAFRSKHQEPVADPSKYRQDIWQPAPGYTDDSTRESVKEPGVTLYRCRYWCQNDECQNKGKRYIKSDDSIIWCHNCGTPHRVRPATEYIDPDTLLPLRDSMGNYFRADQRMPKQEIQPRSAAGAYYQRIEPIKA